MLHCPPKTFMRKIVIFRNTSWRLALRRRWRCDPTGDWRVADGVANIRVAQCDGSMWGAVAWEKTPGGRDSHNPDVSKQNRPTLGMPILIDMKKEAGRRSWEGQVYNAKDGQDLQFDDQADRSRPSRDQGLRAGLSLRRRNLDPRRSPIPAPPTAGQGAPKTTARCQAAHRASRRTVRRPGASSPVKNWLRRAAGRSGRRYLPTPRHRGVCPLTPAETAAPRPAS